MNKQIRKLVNILTILTLIIGSITILQTNGKIFRTSVQLFILRDNASFYNEQYRKTDTMTDEYLKNDLDRKAIYNSEDIVIRKFSNQNWAIKLVLLIWSSASFVLIPYMWIFHIAQRINRMKIKSQKRKVHR